MIVIGIIGVIFMAGNILLIANWLAEKGVPEKANWIRENFLTGTAIAVIIALLILLVSPGVQRQEFFSSASIIIPFFP
jgi:hydrogenase-4 membrane subunit HyfE